MRNTWITGLSCAVAGALAASTLIYSFGPRSAANAADSNLYRQLNLFGNVFDRVRANYVEKPNVEKLVDAAINGMLASLDPHSSYLNADRHKDMQVETRGEFGGLGIEVTMENGLIKVVSPIDDTPAARADILAGDLISHLDGERVLGLTLQEAVGKMRGLVNTPITLTIVRKGKDAPFDVKIVRDIIKIRAVRSRVEGKDKDIGYIRITKFNQQTQENLNRAIKKLNSEIGGKLKGFVVDLRNNPGGLLDQAVSVSDTFLERGEIVSTRGRNPQETQRFSANIGDLTKGKPVVVLINGGSASASEIVAGALQDHDRATIIGTRSFGKGSVQTIIPMGSHGALRLTTARYYTPSGVSIQAKGIRPDVVVEQNVPEDIRSRERRARGEASLRGHLKGENEEEASGSSSYIPPEREKDTQLNYAVDILNGIKTIDKSVDGKKAKSSTAPTKTAKDPKNAKPAPVPN